MIRGTTNTNVFTLPFGTDEIADVRVAYAQSDNLVFVKPKSELTMEGDKITVVLSQEDTLKFSDKGPVQIQLRVKKTSGDVVASEPLSDIMEKTFDEEVM